MKLDATPEAILLDIATTAVLVVDMQNDFGSKGGMFDRAGIDISGIYKTRFSGFFETDLDARALER
jgi:nicotinamidase-related amidase